MKTKTALLSLLAASVIAGTAFAGILDEPKMMAPFFTDKTMKTMKSDAQMKKVWAKMSKKEPGGDDEGMPGRGDEQAACRILRQAERAGRPRLT